VRSLAVVLPALLLAGCPDSQDPIIEPPCEGPACEEPPTDCEPDREVGGDWTICARTSSDAYVVVAEFHGATLDVARTTVSLAGVPQDPAAAYDATTKRFTFRGATLAPGKYSYLIRTPGARPLFVPMWIGAGVEYAGFTWYDSNLYQIVTDRFLDGDPSNNIDNSQGDLARVTDPRSQWQGGDFAGILAKIEDGYFEDMGINTLWISSPLLQSHSSQPGVGVGDPQRYASYHAYHPVVTGYTHDEKFGYTNPIEPAFGTEEELHALVRAAHARGMRIVPDFVTNHVQREARIYTQHTDWFFPYNPCDGNWDSRRIDCWFTFDMPDFDFGGNTAAIDQVVDHALWMIQEYDFDGYRADALKHMDDSFVRALRAAVIDEIETVSSDASVFYMVGESLGGWARYHVRADMVQGQVDEEYYQKTKAALLTFDMSVRALADFAIPNDTAYTVPRETFGAQGGYAGAIMGNFFGNHDQVRALTEAQNSGGGYERLRLAQVFLMTSPRNIPMVYQGDDIGTTGGQDPDNRKMQRFTGLNGEELASLQTLQRAGKARAEHAALRRGTRTNVVVEDWYWVYKVSDGADDVYVAINRDNAKQWSPPAGYVDVLGNCSGGVVPVLTGCIFVKQ